MYSAQNIDRLVTMFRACIQSGRHLVLDLYAASIAAATGNPNIPKAGFEKLLVYVPLRQRIQVKESREFDRVSGIKAVRIFPEELAASGPRTGADVQDLDDVRDRGGALLERRLCRLVDVARLPRTAGPETVAEFLRAARYSRSLRTMRLGTRTFRIFSAWRRRSLPVASCQSTRSLRVGLANSSTTSRCTGTGNGGTCSADWRRDRSRFFV